MTKDQAVAAMYTFLVAIMKEVGIEGDTELRIKLDGETVKTVRLDEAMDAYLATRNDEA